MADNIHIEHVYDDSGPVGIIACPVDVTREELERLVREYRAQFGDTRRMVFRTQRDVRYTDPTLTTFHEPQEGDEV